MVGWPDYEPMGGVVGNNHVIFSSLDTAHRALTEIAHPFRIDECVLGRVWVDVSEMIVFHSERKMP